ncbi:sigma 54-interacting transcriptional regulator [Fulvivirgaceae bacterium PWU37]|uniref:Sigma 54-interacting transcriptional regulator n=1 Tax=Dawidia soli TaxID=2782352 RepID=A0AAP2DGB6_9BACT|nr:sigma 54-interacting transcriptional regulator [Dawidia soli]
MLESELFGHAEGAFTGATKAKKGYLEEAQEGTLFLDEVGEMPIDLKAKLLRVLEPGEFYRVGESRARRVNVRVTRLFASPACASLEREHPRAEECRRALCHPERPGRAGSRHAAL